MIKSCGMYTSDLEGTLELDNIVISEGHLPKEYNLSGQTGNIIDQGNRGICVSVSMCEMLSYIFKQKNKIFESDLDYFYNNRTDKEIDGMTPREALEIAQRDFGVSLFGRVTSGLAIRSSLVANGPVMICLPVRTFDDDCFWKGSDNYGGHAVVVTGYEKDGFIFKNSWGPDYADSGYGLLPEKDLNYILEAWSTVT